MKRVSLTVFICLAVLSSIAFAQDSPIDKGSVMAGGGFSYTNYVDNDYSVITFDPSFNYFVTPGFSMGAALMFSRQSNGSTYSAYGIGPSFKYYIDVTKKRDQMKGTIYPYFGIEFMVMKESQDNYGYNSDRTTKGFALQWGIMTMVADNAGFFTELEYQSTKVEDYDSVKVFRIHGGFSYFIY